MTIEQQVCSLELAKRLKELGVKQESLYGWRKRHHVRDEWVLWSSGSPEDFVDDESFSAFTVAELGIKVGVAKSANVMKAYGHVWNVPDTNRITELGLLGCMTDPNTAAAMLIYLLENGLLPDKKQE